MFASEWECIYTRKSLIDQCRRRTSLNNETSVTVQQVIQCAQCGSIKWRRILFVFFFFACNRRTISGFIYSNELNWINTGNFIVYFWGEKRFFVSRILRPQFVLIVVWSAKLLLIFRCVCAVCVSRCVNWTMRGITGPIEEIILSVSRLNFANFQSRYARSRSKCVSDHDSIHLL